MWKQVPFPTTTLHHCHSRTSLLVPFAFFFLVSPRASVRPLFLFVFSFAGTSLHGCEAHARWRGGSRCVRTKVCACACLCTCACMYVCVCVCVCGWAFVSPSANLLVSLSLSFGLPLCCDHHASTACMQGSAAPRERQRMFARGRARAVLHHNGHNHVRCCFYSNQLPFHSFDEDV